MPGGRQITRKEQAQMSDTPDTGAAFEIPGADGEIVRGNVHLPADDPGGRLPLVLLLHGFKGYKDYGFFPHLTQRLADGGLVAARFNFSHNGIDDDPSTFGRPDLFERDAWSKQLADVQAVIAAAEAGDLPHADRMDLERLAILGHSRGGVTALLTAGSDPRVKATVSLSAPSSTASLLDHDKQAICERGYIVSPSSRTGQDLRIGRAWLDDLEQNAEKLDLLAAVGRIDGPLLIVHGTADASVPADCAHAIAGACGGEPEVLLIDGAGHTFDCVNPFDGPSPALDKLIAAVTGFLGRICP
jgi:dipeptidyl aminopeptidase/acylaminoacyl peptidase